MCSILLSIYGCEKKDQTKHNKYTILIGRSTFPEFDGLVVGQKFGGTNYVMALSRDRRPFGMIEIYCDGKLEATFYADSIVIAQDKGNLLLKGRLNTELKLLLLKKTEGNGAILVKKDKLPKTETLIYKINLEEY